MTVSFSLRDAFNALHKLLLVAAKFPALIVGCDDSETIRVNERSRL